MLLMQTLSKTIHCAKFVADAKLRASPDAYAAATETQVSAIHQSIEANVKDKPDDGAFSSPFWYLKGVSGMDLKRGRGCL